MEGFSHPVEQSLADAVVRMAEAYLRMRGRGEGLDLVGGDDPRALVVVHVDEPTLGRCETERGKPVPHETLRRLACDAALVHLRLDGTIGRRSRVVPRWMRRAVRRRDRTCRFPGCDAKVADIHHIVYWSRGGPTSTWNLMLACPFHHRLLHEGGYTVTIGADGRLTFRRPDGTVIDRVGATGGRYVADRAVSATAAQQPTYTAMPDYSVGVGALLDACPRTAAEGVGVQPAPV